MILTGLVAMGVQAANPQRQWVFDYTIDGPRQARPEVHGDKEELFIQFPKGVRPHRFHIRSCHDNRPRRIKAHRRGPYYVLTRQGKSLRITTNKGSVRISGDTMCAKYREKALARKLALEEKARKAAAAKRKVADQRRRELKTEKESRTGFSPIEGQPLESHPLPPIVPTDPPTVITYRNGGNRGYNNFLSVTEGAPYQQAPVEKEPQQQVQQDYFKGTPNKQQTAEVFIHARNKPLKRVLARIYPGYQIEIRRKAIGIRSVSITGKARPDFLYEELMEQMPDIKGWRYRKERLLVIDYRKEAKR